MTMNVNIKGVSFKKKKKFLECLQGGKQVPLMGVGSKPYVLNH